MVSLFLTASAAGCRSKQAALFLTAKKFSACKTNISSDGLQGGRKSVCYYYGVDDRAGIRKLLQEVLQSAGYDMLTAASGDEAVALFSKTPLI